MKYYLSSSCCLKRLEEPCVYHVKKDELYEVDEVAYHYLQLSAQRHGADAPEDPDFLQFCLDEDILTCSPVPRLSMEPQQSPIPSLRYLELQITNRCNLRCRHCYVGDPARTELSPQALKQVLDEFQAMQGLRLLITGGEPLLHTHFEEFNAMLPDYGFRKVLFTNGQQLSDKVLSRLHVDEVQVSIDGMLKGHDAMRGAGTFEKAMATVGRIRQTGMPLSIATLVHRENLDEFETMNRLFQDMGVLDWSVDVPTPAGFFLECPELHVPPEIAGAYLSYGFGGGVHGGGQGYACGLHLASVLANGDVCKCAFYADTPVGSILDGLALCWAKIRPMQLDELACAAAGCPVLEECRGGCRYRAGCSASESMPAEKLQSAPDLYKCFSYGIIESDGGHEDRL